MAWEVLASGPKPLLTAPAGVRSIITVDVTSHHTNAIPNSCMHFPRGKDVNYSSLFTDLLVRQRPPLKGHKNYKLFTSLGDYSTVGQQHAGSAQG